MYAQLEAHFIALFNLSSKNVLCNEGSI